MMQNSGSGAPGSSVTDGTGSPKERVGETIKRERERRQMSIDTVAKTLKLNPRYIEALEENRYDQLPGGTYIRVYLRSLSRFLALDSEEIFRRFFEERGLTGADTLRKDSSTKINLKAQEDKKNNTPVIAIFSAIALLAVFSFFVNRQGCHSSPAGKNARVTVGTAVRAGVKQAAETARQTDTVLSVPKPAAAKQTPVPAVDSLHNVKRTEIRPEEKHARDTVSKPAAGAVQTVKGAAVPVIKPLAAADTAPKRVTPPAVAVKKDTVKPAGAAGDTPQIKTGPVQTQKQIDTGSMVLRMTVVGDSCWGRVISDGAKDWKNTLLNGKGISLPAADSFNVHVGAADAVAFTLNGRPLEIPKKKGVITFKVDKSGVVTLWTLEKWNSVFEKRP